MFAPFLAIYGVWELPNLVYRSPSQTQCDKMSLAPFILFYMCVLFGLFSFAIS
jgi:hypothetical protein